MATRGLGRIFDLNPSAMRRDDSRDAAVRQLEAKVGDGASARLIAGVVLTAATAKDVPHLVGRALKGWRVVDIDANTTVKRSPSADDAKWLRLTAAANATVSIEVW